MRREFPVLWAKISITLATPLIIGVAILYMGKFVMRPASELYGFGLSALGITAGLAAICLQAVSPVLSDHTLSVLRYSGEKFLHSCLLMTQVLIIAFARDTILTWMTGYEGLKLAVAGLAKYRRCVRCQ